MWFFPIRQAAELMSPPAATTTELLQVKVKAALLEQSFPKLPQEEVCKTLQEPSGAHWGGLGQVSAGHASGTSWKGSLYGAGQPHGVRKPWGWARTSLSPPLQAGRLVLEWMGWWRAGSWVELSESIGSQQDPSQGQHPPEGSHKI